MAKIDPRIDAYIDGSAEFAKPILIHFRKLVHSACPDAEETLKWGSPHFLHHGMYCGMAAFKEHCALLFWKARLLFGKNNSALNREKDSRGHFGRIASLSDLPPDKVLIGYLKEAARLNENGVKLPARPKSKVKKELVVPDYFMNVLKKNRKALAAFEAFSPSHKKEYVEWITEAKREETRQRRVATAIEWMAEGKPRNWKYC